MTRKRRVVKSDKQWKQELTPEEFEVIRNKETEAPFTGAYNDVYEKGTYVCKACGNVLFLSSEKFDSGSGWPSFFEPASDDAIDTAVDASHGMERTEVLCDQCGAHLGHLFNDGPKVLPDGRQANGKRYCINSIALDLKPDA